MVNFYSYLRLQKCQIRLPQPYKVCQFSRLSGYGPPCLQLLPASQSHKVFPQLFLSEVKHRLPSGQANPLHQVINHPSGLPSLSGLPGRWSPWSLCGLPGRWHLPRSARLRCQQAPRGSVWPTSLPTLNTVGSSSFFCMANQRGLPDHAEHM